MQSAKEAASNVAASAKSGMEKTKAVAEEKVGKMTTRDPVKKEIAEQKKEARISEAERMKQDARAENAAARREHGVGHGHGYTAAGADATGYSTGTTDRPGFTPQGPVREDHPTGVTRGSVGSQYPAGTNTGSGRTGVQDPRVAGGKDTAGYGPGATY